MPAISNRQLALGPGEHVDIDMGQAGTGRIAAHLSALSSPVIPTHPAAENPLSSQPSLSQNVHPSVHDLPQTVHISVPNPNLQDLRLELLRSGVIVAQSDRPAIALESDGNFPWQLRVTSRRPAGLSHCIATIEFPEPDPAPTGEVATLEAIYKVDESHDGTLRHWQAVVELPPLSRGIIMAQQIDGPFGAQLRLAFMAGDEVLAEALNHLVELDFRSGVQPSTLRVTCDAPPAATTSVTVRLLYPSTHRIVTRQIPIQFFTRVFDEFWNNRKPPPLAVSITDHKLLITFDAALARAQGLEDISVPLPPIDVPVVGNDIRIMGLSSKSVRLSVAPGPNLGDSIRVAPALPSKYPQAAHFIVDVEFIEPGAFLDVNNAPDVSMHDVSLRLAFALGNLGSSLYLYPDVSIQIRSAEVVADVIVADVDVAEVAGTIESHARDAIISALGKGTTMARIGDAMRPWLLGGAHPIIAAGAQADRIMIDYIEPPTEAPSAVQLIPIAQGNLSRVKHLVILMMENRSFDHMLGYLSLSPRASGQPVNGLTGQEVNHFNGQAFPTHLLPTTLVEFSPPHGFIPTHNQISDHMGGFVAAFAKAHAAEGADPSVVMGHYDGNLLPVFDQLAAQFAICDNWHAAHPGPTWPNRFITMSGTLNKDAFGQFELDNPDLATFVPSSHSTIFDVLSKRKVSWSYYENGYSFIRLFTRYTFDVDHVLGFSTFLQDAAAGTLPQVSFIDPDFIEFPPGADDQAPSDPIDGQVFIGTVVNALMASPAWADTLLIVTYDEHGGFFDHVEPPPTPVIFEADMDRYGLRVPTFVVSPLVEPGKVSSELFDHASILATIQRTFLGPEAPDLGTRVAHAADVGSLLTRAAPRTSLAPLTLPQGTKGRTSARVQMPIPDRGSAEFNDLLFMSRMFTGMGPK